MDVTLQERPVTRRRVGQELRHEIEAHEFERTAAGSCHPSEVTDTATHVQNGRVDISQPVEDPIEDALFPFVEHRSIVDVHRVGVPLCLALLRDEQGPSALIHAPTVSLGLD
jgi:hypothetical protein